jgi:small subunit ribosomal protein S3
MGQKTNPIGFRLGINRTWDSRWYAGKNEYAKLLHEDIKIREVLHKELKQAAVSRIVIERPHKKCRVTVHSARPGVVIGKKGADIDKLRKMVANITDADVVINIVEIRKPELDAALVAESIAQQLERRVAFRRAMKRAVQSAMRLGAQGIRINCSGRLGGAEIARMEWYREGRVPLHTLRADIDYGVSTAFTTFGTCGVKVWIFKGEILEHDPMAQERRMAEGDTGNRRDPPKSPQGRNSGPPSGLKGGDAQKIGNTENSPPAATVAREPRILGRIEKKEGPKPPAEPTREETLPPDWIHKAEPELMSAFKTLSTNGAASRKGAVNALLKQARFVMLAKTVPRPLTKRIAAVMPALFESLFDPDADVRWAAAYAIAALRAPKRFAAESAPVEHNRDIENAVLNELKAYFKERGSKDRRPGGGNAGRRQRKNFRSDPAQSCGVPPSTIGNSNCRARAGP